MRAEFQNFNNNNSLSKLTEENYGKKNFRKGEFAVEDSIETFKVQFHFLIVLPFPKHRYRI